MRGLLFIVTAASVLGCNGIVTPPGPAEKDKGKVGLESVTIKKLMSDLPEDIHPKDSEDTVRIQRANAWLAENAVGRQLVNEHVFDSVSVETTGGKNQFRVILGDDSEITTVALPTADVYRPWYYSLASGDKYPYNRGICLESVNEAEAQRLSDLKKTSVTVAGTIQKMVFSPGGPGRPNYLIINLSDVNIRSSDPPDATPEE